MKMEAPGRRGMTLRPYQQEAVRRSVEALRRDRSTLVVMPTGTGKTQVFVSIAGMARGRVLMLAHRDELVGQAAARVQQMLGLEADIEKASSRAPRPGSSIVVGSVQTMRGARLTDWPRDVFSLVVVDEAHHSAADSYRAIVDHFGAAKVIGVTATPDRTDQKALGEVYDSVAFEYSIIDAINDGWLVEPVAERVVLKSVDLSDVRSVAGDLHQAQLEERISETGAIHAIAAPLLELAGDRRTVIYTPGVASAHSLAEVLCESRPGCARALDGTTPTPERRALLKEYDAGVYQYLVNCMVLTEGWDSPGVSCVAIARPTKSRSLYAQMLGRGLRPAPGKTDCLVIDYVDVTRRCDLAGPEDALGGEWGDEVVSEAKRERTKDEPVKILDILKRAKAKVVYRTKREKLLAARKAAVKDGSGRKIIPAAIAWDLFGLDLDELERSVRWGIKPASEAQIKQLLQAGLDPGEVGRDVAAKMIATMAERLAARLASPAQLKLLSRYGETRPDMTASEAKSAIDAIAARGWRR